MFWKLCVSRYSAVSGNSAYIITCQAEPRDISYSYVIALSISPLCHEREFITPFHNAKVIVMSVINQYTKIYYYCPVVYEVCLSPGGLSKFGSMWSQEAPDQIEAGKVANAHTSATDVTSA